MHAAPRHLEGVLTALLAARGRLSLLQCGANDGITVDPIHHFLKSNMELVQAVAVEPLPDVFAQLQTTYEGYTGVRTLNLAVGPDEIIDLYRIKPAYASHYKGIIASGITSFDRNHVLSKARKQLHLPDVPEEDRVETLSIPCKTVSALIDEHADVLGINPFVQIDAEGFDDEIIYTIDFARHRPIGLNYEAELLSDAKRTRLHNHIKKQGYRIFEWSPSDETALLFS